MRATANSGTVHRLVVCCKAGTNECDGCTHDTPHPRDMDGELCTKWGECMRKNGRTMRVRCITHNTNMSSGD